jgi:hypothetical protein
MGRIWGARRPKDKKAARAAFKCLELRTGSRSSLPLCVWVPWFVEGPVSVDVRSALIR